MFWVDFCNKVVKSLDILGMDHEGVMSHRGLSALISVK